MSRWQQIDTVFKAALERPSGERPAFLDEACADDVELRREVESLLAHDEAASFMKTAAFADAARVIARERGAPDAGQSFGPYKILDRLGAGGMGEVFLAQKSGMARKVALKLLPEALTKDEEHVRRFVQEAHTVSSLNHPNILTVYEIGEIEGRHFIASEYVEGETLRRRMMGAPLKTAEAVDVAAQIAAALDAAHKAGIVHRDIKPENVMLRADGYVKVLDFGLAKLTESRAGADGDAPTLVPVNTDTGVVMGTVSYMSPEQARGLEVDARTDVFSLGIVLYEMASGRAPFEGETKSDVLVSILEREPPPLGNLCDAPDELERIVTKALAKKREARYQTVRDLLIDLQMLKRRMEVEASLGRGVAAQQSHGARARGSGGERTDPLATNPAGEQAAITSQNFGGVFKRHRAVAASLLALAVVAAVAGVLYYRKDAAGATNIESLAVLPFANAGANPETEYLSDGVTESIINSLSELPNLRVMSRNSVFRYKGQEADAQAVGNALNVRAVLTGRVVQRGEDLNVSVELVDARDNRHLWGAQYNRRLSDILAVQGEIAQDISEKLRTRLTGEERRRVTRRYTDNVEAYRLYLKGLQGWREHTPQSLKQSVEHLHQAIRIDPAYAPAYVGLATSYGSLANMNVLTPQEGYTRARWAAEQAVLLDDSLAEAHAAVAFVKSYYEWDWEGAERSSRRALELNPNYPLGYPSLAACETVRGRFEEAAALARKEQEVDPLTPLNSIHVGGPLALAGKYDEAIAQYRKALELDPKFMPAYGQLGQTYAWMGKYAEAEAEFERGIGIHGRVPPLVAGLGHVYAASGRREEARRVLDELEAMSKQRRVSPYFKALVHVGLGERERTLALLEEARDERYFHLPFIKYDPRFKDLRPDPRFQQLLRSMNLEP